MKDNALQIEYPLHDLTPACLTDDDFDRPGFLTPSDRRLIVEGLEENADSNQIRQQRYQLRQRILGALQDFGYLALLANEEREQLLASIIDAPPEVNRRIWMGFEDLGQHLLYPLNEQRFEQTLVDYVHYHHQITHYIENGDFRPVDVEINVEVEDPIPIEDLERRRERGEELDKGAELVLEMHRQEWE